MSPVVDLELIVDNLLRECTINKEGNEFLDRTNVRDNILKLLKSFKKEERSGTTADAERIETLQKMCQDLSDELHAAEMIITEKDGNIQLLKELIRESGAKSTASRLKFKEPSMFSGDNRQQEVVDSFVRHFAAFSWTGEFANTEETLVMTILLPRTRICTSSRYETIVDVGRAACSFSRLGRNASENSRGPRGSPWRTPCEEASSCPLPRARSDGFPYAHAAARNRLGAYLATVLAIVFLSIALKAFERSNEATSSTLDEFPPDTASSSRNSPGSAPPGFFTHSWHGSNMPGPRMALVQIR